eukprot:GEMP01001360.1.p1 GENE.GEMP01001360.1~~GEMP01001360.1.p1  ORF type:complete len:1506 (+),score=342.41 GEMP01001360.1:117-4634(+)
MSEEPINETVQEICKTAGVDVGLWGAPEKIEHLQLILDNYCGLKVIRQFKNLRTLTLIQQGVSRIYGLGYLKHLEALWLNENKITCLDGIQGCRNLKRLYVCGNKIKEIGNWLLGLKEVHTFWISENKLTTLQGISNLPKLRHLVAASNDLCSLDNVFYETKLLETINVANNRLLSFDCIHAMQMFEHLTELDFTDPEFGSNPICQVTNYSIYALYQLKTLTILDRHRVTDEEREKAETEYMKKRIYYNMRIKSTLRHANDTLKRLKEMGREQINVSNYQLMLLRRERVSMVDHTCAKALALDDKALAKYAEVEDIKQTIHYCRHRVREECQRIVSADLLEHENGGMVWIEAGDPATDPWHGEVAHHVLQSFEPSDGIAGIKITGVSKLHDQIHEMMFGELLGSDELCRKPNGTSLFFQLSCQHACPAAASPQLPSHDTPELYLTNNASLEVTSQVYRFRESPAGKAFVRAFEKAHSAAPCSAKCGPIAGRLVLYQMYLGSMKPDVPSSFEWDMERRNVQNVYANSPSKISSCATPYRVRSGEARTKLWYVRDRRYALPSYVVDFDFRYDNDEMDIVDNNPADDEHVEGPVMEKEGEKKRFTLWLRELRLFVRLVVDADSAIEQVLAMHPAVVTPAPLERLAYEDLRDDRSIAQNGANTEEVYLHNRGLRRLEPMAFGFMKYLRVLVLSFNKLESVSYIGPLPALQSLDLSFNLIEKMDAFNSYPALTTLNLSHNALRFKDDICHVLQHASMPSLCHVHLIGNPICECDEYRMDIMCALPHITTLDHAELTAERERDNASSLQHTGRCAVTEKMLFDSGAFLAPSTARAMERQWFFCKPEQNGSIAEHIRIMCRARETREGSRSSSPDKRNSATTPVGGGGGDDAPQQTSAATSPERRARRPRFAENRFGKHNGVDPMRPRCSCGHTNGDDDGDISKNQNWLQCVASVDLSGRQLHAVDAIASCKDLMWLNLRSNQLTSIKALGVLSELRGLNVGQNALTNLAGVESMMQLTRLDAGNNKLVDVAELARCGSLQQLSLEENYVDSLETFGELRGLVELYLSNNLVENLRSALALKNLPKIAIVDLTDNPLSTVDGDHQQYRHYLVYYVRTLKVLDSAYVTQTEIQEAHERFAGKLSMEFFEEKLGPLRSAGYTIRSLDLSNSRIKEVAPILGDMIFPCLRELIINNNMLSSSGLKPMGPLSKLSVLRCSHTKLDIDEGLVPKEEDANPPILVTLSKLRVLELNYNGLESILGLSQLPLKHLRILHMVGNDIQRLEGIGHMVHLRELVLNKNRIRHIDGDTFRGLRSLRCLRMEECGLRALDAFEHLPRTNSQLTHLCLGHNRVQDMVEMQNLVGLSNLHTLDFTGTPIAKRPWYRASIISKLPSVQIIDGKEVADEEREAPGENGMVKVNTWGHVAGSKPSVVHIVLEKKGRNISNNGVPCNVHLDPIHRGLALPVNGLKQLGMEDPKLNGFQRFASDSTRIAQSPRVIINPSLRSHSVPSKRRL